MDFIQSAYQVECLLNRGLNDEERSIIDNFLHERTFNKKFEKLHVLCKSKNLYVPILTNLNGDCLFESLVYSGIGKNVVQLRRMISLMLYMYKNHKYLVLDAESTFYELFKLTNEIKYVKSGDEHYVYTYEAMCQDVSNSQSWSKLPTELILMIISYIYKIEIIVLNNVNDYEIRICSFDKEKFNNKPIFLGHIHESHYLPLIMGTGNETPLYYNNYYDDMILIFNNCL
jgi:hypothetical protein